MRLEHLRMRTYFHGHGYSEPFCSQYCQLCALNSGLASLRTIARNLRDAAGLCAAFRAGDNFGFHMGSDESQCTCQWSPNTRGEAYVGSTRCEHDVLDDPEDRNTDCRHCEGYGCSSCNPLVGDDA